MKTKWVTPPTCGVQSMTQFLYANNVHLAKIHRQIAEVYGEMHWRKGMCGNGVRCAKNAGLMCMMRNEVGTHLWS